MSNTKSDLQHPSRLHISREEEINFLFVLLRF